MGNEMVHHVKKTGEEVKEHMWDLPMWEEYVDLTKSTVADYKNLTYSAGAGAIMGGAFLYNFVPLKEKNIQWIHMDIAGVDFLASPTSTRSAGALAGGFRTMLHVAKDLQEKR
jgi:leucyl aminopeptidase